MIQVHGLYVSPGHNYFGHYGQAAGEHPIEERQEIECVAGRGILGDRFFDYKADYKGQITFFSREVFEQLCRELNLAGAHPAATRRNVLVSGVELATLIGVRFEIQGVQFEGSEECRPCAWMEQALGEGAEQWLRGRGGLRARIVTSGTLRRNG